MKGTVSVFYQDGGIESSMTRLYNDKYSKLDRCAIDHYVATVGEPRATADILPYDEFLQPRIYRELIKHYVLVDNMTTALDTSATSVASVPVFRHEAAAPDRSTPPLLRSSSTRQRFERHRCPRSSPRPMALRRPNCAS